jgi:hypothetical protein
MTKFNINPRFVMVDNGERPTAGYPVNSILYDMDIQLFYQWDGTTWNDSKAIPRGPITGKDTGIFNGTASSGFSGMLNGAIARVGTAVGPSVDSTYGGYYANKTAATTGTEAGYHNINSALFIRKFNPFVAITIRPSIATNQRIYCGLTSTSAHIPASGTEDLLAGISGVALLQRSTDTQYQICSNNGAANSTIVSTGVNVSTTTPVTIFIKGDETNTRWRWSIDEGATWNNITDGPAQTTNVGFIIKVQTAENVEHHIQLFGVEVVSDK